MFFLIKEKNIVYFMRIVGKRPYWVCINSDGCLFLILSVII